MARSDDMKAYRDLAITQGRRAIEQARTVLTEMASDADSISQRAQARGQSLVRNIRSADRDRLIDAARADLETFLGVLQPYVAEAARLRDLLVSRVDHAVSDARKDPRVAKAYDNAEALADTVAAALNERVVAPAVAVVKRQGGGEKATASDEANQTPVEPEPAAKRAPEKRTASRAAPRKATSAKATVSESAAPKPSAAETDAKSSTAKTTAGKPNTAKPTGGARRTTRTAAATQSGRKTTTAKRTPTENTSASRIVEPEPPATPVATP